MRSLFLFLAMFIVIGSVSAQEEPSYKIYHQHRQKISRNGMGVLGGWAVANLGYGTVQYFRTEGEMKYFHQMNALWNIANLSIAIPGYMGSKGLPDKMGPVNSLRKQEGHERVFLFNGGLDVGYIMGGLYLREVAHRQGKWEERFRGYGNSLILQGGFLLGFDAVMYWLHKRNGDKRLEPLLENVEIGMNRMRITIPLGRGEG